MKYGLGAALGLVAFMAAGSATATESEKNALAEAAKTAVDRGERLYAYDQAGWHGTDDFRAKHSSLMNQAGGYVVTGDGAEPVIAFFDKSKSRALYRATLVGGKLAKSGPPAAEQAALTPLELKMIASKEKAVQAFAEEKVGLCADANPNVAALPPLKPGEPTIVYVMTPQTDVHTFPLGGHYSVEVADDGTVGKVRPFAKSCIGMPLNQVPKGAQPLAFAVTHLLDPTPTEIHVFTSMTSKIPIYVATSNKRIWAVEGNSIRTLK